MTESDLKIEWYSGTGKGGQHRNKHQNCCRITHIPTGIKANGTENRSREANRKAALGVLRARLAAHMHQDTERYRATSERVRTYHELDNRVTDHASGESMLYTEALKNGITPLIDARRIAKGS